METLVKDYAQTKNGFKVIQEEHKILSLQKTGEAFHFIDQNYLNRGILFHGWIGYRKKEQIIEVLEGHFWDTFIKYPCKKMLIENSKMTGSFSGINNWLTNTFMPRMIEKGLKQCAVVYPANIFAQLAVEDWDQKVGGFHNKSFKSEGEALTWLKMV